MEQSPKIESVVLKEELLEMARKDQEMREKAREHSDLYDENVDKQNTERLKEIIEEIGWPNSQTVGAEGSHAAWLIAQHADHDPEFQENCLSLLESDDDIDRADIAYLTDRVRVNTGKKQLYGTQFGANGEPHPIENQQELDSRRREAGLEPFEEYKKIMNEL